MTMGHYLKSMKQLTDQFTPSNYRDPKRQRLYLKDIDCPGEWAKDLKGFIPEIFYYLNECIESRTGGDGAILEPNEYGQMRYGKGVAPAGDLMSSLPKEMQALNMMCYIGHEGTFTPAHREMCASLGHNIMVETSTDGAFEKAGSSIWFMTETKEREVVSEYFLSMLGHDIEVEKHFAQINAWKKAPFNVWIVEQKLGDLILIPPLAPHQVWNRGTRTMKAAWNRTTIDTLELAINEALPRARMVCREEQYKNKAIIYYTLVKYYALVTRDTIEEKMWKYGRIKQLFEDFKRLLALFTDILVSEMFSAVLPTEKDVEFLEYDSNVTCSYCRCNIWNRFLTCKTCIEVSLTGEEDTYDICMDCYAMGRSCGCISNLKWVEQWKWSTLTLNYEAWRNIVVQYDGYFNLQTSPQPLEVARKRFGKKPVAQICQEQLKLRPWQDIKNPVPRSPSPGMSCDEPDVDDEGRIKKKRGGKKSTRGRIMAKKGKTRPCHVCCHHHENWRMAFCTTCTSTYCYGVLWRAFDMMPQEVMEDRDWSCPKCLKICSCGKCRKSPDQNSYAPKGTLLGHDTRKVADYRSVESLVDFSKTNLGWLRGENDNHPQESARMKKLRDKAEAEKNREDDISEKYLIDEGGAQLENEQPEAPQAPEHPQFDNMDDIDPQLRGPTPSVPRSNSNGNSHFEDSFAPAGAEMNGVGHGQFDGAGAEGENYSWLEGQYDLEYLDAFNRGVEYPSRPLALEGPMVASSPADATEPPEPERELEVSYPEPSHHGQARMMGIGYYQQGTGGDKIVYEPPGLDEINNDTINLATAANNPNFALSDLLPPEEQSTQKKRKIGHRSDNEQDVEFFTSKKARKLAETKRHSGMSKFEPNTDDGDHGKAVSVPRRCVPKPKTYIDLGEESLPFTEDDILPAIKNQQSNHPGRKPNAENGGVSKSKSLREEASSRVTPSTTPAPAKTLRKSAWLARKQAEERGEEVQVHTPKKGHPRRNSVPKRTSIDVSSDEESDNPFATNLSKKGRGRPGGSAKRKTKSTAAIDISSDAENHGEEGIEIDDDDNLFGDHDAGEWPSDGRNADEGIKWRASNKDPKVQIAGPPSGAEVKEQRVQIPPAKRRGRPPKQAPVAATSPPRAPAWTTKLLSLKEKLALEGKAFKIVAKNPRESLESLQINPVAHTARTTPSIVIPARSTAFSVPLLSPEGPPAPSMDRFMTIVRKDSPENSPSNQNSWLSSRQIQEPVVKGPTVVRLESSSDESPGSERSRDPPSSDDDDDESIPAVRPSLPKLSRGRVSLRGRALSNGVGTRMARRGRPSKSSY
jgi:hypothetical protein